MNQSPRLTIAAGILLTIATIASLPVYPFGWHLFLHIAGAVIFLGNIIVTFGWVVLAEQSGQPAVLRFAVRTISRTDMLFTSPGIALILLNGLALAAERWGGWAGLFEVSWIVLALGLFALSGAVWGLFLLRYQFRLVSMSDDGDSSAPVSDEYLSILHRWYAWGAAATVLPIASLVLMVWKPNLWSS